MAIVISGENAWIVAGYMEDAEALQVQAAVQSLDEHIPWSKHSIEGSWPEGDGWIKLEVHGIG